MTMHRFSTVRIPRGIRPRPIDAAIVGMACQFPGAADLVAFFEDACVPGGRGSMNLDKIRREHVVAPLSISIQSGTLEPDDPQSSAILDVVRSALADAGFAAGIPKGCKVDVIIGRGNAVDPGVRTGDREGFPTTRVRQIHRIVSRSGESSAIDAAVTGGSIAATFIDAAGASSLLAIDLGARSLRRRSADLVVAGGGDGVDGVGVVVLKRAADADRDEDRVYAILKGLEIEANRGDRRRSRAIRGAYRRSGIDPADVGLLDADPRSIAGLRSVFAASERRVFGASSTGMAGLIKSALALHHRVLPPTDRSDETPAASLATARFNATVRPWFLGDSRPPRLAAVDAIGPVGVGAHAILEGAASPARADAAGALTLWDSEAILLGAPDRETWLDLSRSLAGWLASAEDVPLKDVAFTLNVGQPLFPFRVGIVATSIDDLRSKLKSAIESIDASSNPSIRDVRGIYCWDEPLAREGSLAFLFPGEGSQYPGMLADLCPHFPEVGALFDTADRVARDQGHTRLPSDHLLLRDDSALWSLGTAINVVLSSQWALYQVLIRLGLRPGAVLGHSSGEFLALGASGVLRIDRKFEDGIGALGSVFEELDALGSIPSAALLAVASDRDRVRSIVSESEFPGVSIAIDNCPHQVVLAGPENEIDRVMARLRDARLFAERLPFDRAYHTPEFEPAIAPVREFLDGLTFRKPRIPLYSCSIAERMPDDPRPIRDLAAEQWARPVAFRDTIEAMHADGVRLFVEVGARGNLTGFTEDILRNRRAFSVAANLPRRSGLAQLNHLVASLFAHGVSIRPDHLYARRRPERVRFDVAPSSRRRRTIPLGVSGDRSIDVDPAILAYRRTMEEFVATQESVMDAYSRVQSAPIGEVGPWVGEICSIVPGRELVARRQLPIEGDPVAENHTLGGRRISAIDPELKGLPVVPFTVNVESMTQAAAVLMPGKVVVGLRDVTALRWVRFEENEAITLEMTATRDDSDSNRARVRIKNLGTAQAEGVVVFEGDVLFADAREPAPPAPPFRLRDPGRCRFTAEELYDDQWLFHGPAMKALTRVGASSPGGIDGSIRVLPRRGLFRDDQPGEPNADAVVLDAFTHLLGCWGLDRLTEGDVIFPLRLGSLDIFGDDPPEGDEVDCRIAVAEVDPMRVRVDADFVRKNGSTWMRLSGWEDWRFFWPNRYRDVFRVPDRILIGQEFALDDAPNGTIAVWLEPPGDFGRPIWRDVLEAVQLGPEERRRHTAIGGSESQRSLRLWGKIAAKEAARRLWLDLGGEAVYPADLVIEHDALGRPWLRSQADSNRERMPKLSISHVGGVALAIATLNPEFSPGVDVALIESRGAEFEAIAFSEAERHLLDRYPGDERDEWLARFWCAKEAAGKAVGIGLDGDPKRIEIESADEDFGILTVRVRELRSIRVSTGRRGEYAWAWTVLREQE